MTDTLPRMRMLSQLLAGGDATPTTPVDVVRWFGALQAQDARAATWAVGLRSGAARADVAEAMASGRVVRTWPMRGTLHLVPGEDARWMVQHLGRRALARSARRRADLGLTDHDVERAGEVLADALAGGGRLTRSECVALLAAAGLPTQGQRAYHLLWATCHRGICCLGPDRGREATFVLVADWAPGGPLPDRPEALATVADRFVRSHGPVTDADLARWADLTLTEARTALAAAPGVVGRTIAGTPMHVSPEVLDTATRIGHGAPTAHALPAFDELVIGYRDRGAQLAAVDEARVVPGGGVFSPALVLDGRVVGTWRRSSQRARMILTATLFRALPAGDRDALSAALLRFAAFEGMHGDVRWAQPDGA